MAIDRQSPGQQLAFCPTRVSDGSFIGFNFPASDYFIVFGGFTLTSVLSKEVLATKAQEHKIMCLCAFCGFFLMAAYAASHQTQLRVAVQLLFLVPFFTAPLMVLPATWPLY